MEASVPPTPLSSNSDVGPRKLFIAGVEVEFPTKPYKCQLSTMNMVIRGLRHMTNTLVESPTGSGKTLSLICSSLAWQRAEYARLKEILEKELKENAAKQLEEEKNREVQTKREKELKKQGEREEQNVRFRRQDGGRVVVYYADDEEDMADFQMCPKKTVKKMRRLENSSNGFETPSDSKIQVSDPSDNSGQELIQKCSSPSQCIKSGTCQSKYFAPREGETSTQRGRGVDVLTPSKRVTLDASSLSSQDVFKQAKNGIKPADTKPRVPTIFYCSRTHQQIQQVIRELRKTVYKDVNMTILSSREHTCIQKSGRAKYRTKTELCHTLLDPYDGIGCMYKYNLMSSHTPFENCGLESPWDLEDLVKVGRKVQCCPYFASRDLIATADIVFCPYVYLIDPKIRKSMQLDLRGTVILLDEAHNIEDSCRDAGSYSVLLDEIFQAKMDCEKVAAKEILPEIHKKLARFLCNLMNWMSQKVHLQTDNMKMETSSLDGVNAVASFEKYNINCQSIIEFKENVMEAIANVNIEEQEKNSKQQFERDGLLPVTTFVLEGLSLVLGFMYDNNMKHIRDYYVAVSKNPILSTASRTDMPDDWLNTSGRPRLIVEEDTPNLAWGSYLSFLCMNPSVVFQPIADMVRSIVLTSGTLAPLVTFNSELGTTFANELQALHIIDENQLWVGALGSGPGGSELKACYRLTEMPDFRNELGNTILEVCKVIPYGVLCFLSSYGLLDSLRQHWLKSGLWEELGMHKEVLCEMRGSKDFLPTIQAFYTSVTNCENGVGKGPLLFAIMRGKVSEGLDFADNRARGVITVGIPYPQLYDIQVGLKRKYNDGNITRGLKSGAQWYETQAYRALNQALGRCIRHKNDWGALIIIDKRFITEERHVQGLSKWIRRKVQPFPTFEEFHSSLRKFVQKEK